MRKRNRHRAVPSECPERKASPGCRSLGSGQPYPNVLHAGSPTSLSRPQTLPVGTDACSLARPVSGPFSLPACGQIGNLGRNSYVGPRGFYSDLSVTKSFAITERSGRSSCMNAFNIFNHPVSLPSVQTTGQTVAWIVLAATTERSQGLREVRTCANWSLRYGWSSKKAGIPIAREPVWLPLFFVRWE